MEPYEIDRINGAEGLIARIIQDEHYADHEGNSPRDWSNLGVMVLDNQSYPIGDEDHPYTRRWKYLRDLYGASCTSDSLAAVFAWTGDERWPWPETSNDVRWTDSEDLRVMIPLDFADYGSGGQRLHIYPTTTGQKACRAKLRAMLDRDDDTTGLLVATADMIREEYGEVSAATVRKAARLLEAEAEDYRKYIEGEVCAWTIGTEDKMFSGEACYGYYDKDSCRDDAIEALDRAVEAIVHEREEVQAWAERDVITV